MPTRSSLRRLMDALRGQSAPTMPAIYDEPPNPRATALQKSAIQNTAAFKQGREYGDIYLEPSGETKQKSAAAIAGFQRAGAKRR